MRMWLTVLLLFAVPAQAQEAPRVVATIKPLHSLVAAVMEGVGQPALLVPGGASAHVFQMKPSQAALVQNAELVFYIGTNYETFLAKPLAQRTKENAIAMMDLPGIALLPMREGGNFQEHDDGDEHDHQHAHHGNDPHIWLAPRNAIVMATGIAQALGKRYPEHKMRFLSNAYALKEHIHRLDDELAATLAPVRGKHFIAFHDAYQYLENAYGVRAAGSITINPESPPGAKHISELKQKIAQLHVSCVLREPQFDDRVAQVLVQGTKASAATLDPIGAALPEGKEHYTQTMRRLAGDLAACVSPN